MCTVQPQKIVPEREQLPLKRKLSQLSQEQESFLFPPARVERNFGYMEALAQTPKRPALLRLKKPERVLEVYLLKTLLKSDSKRKQILTCSI